MTASNRYLISGKVQGVGFRYFTQRAAVRAGLSGWVRNLDDGRVEAAACGPAQQLREFECALHAGPRGAQVTEVAAVPEQTFDTGAFVITD